MQTSQTPDYVHPSHPSRTTPYAAHHHQSSPPPPPPPPNAPLNAPPPALPNQQDLTSSNPYSSLPPGWSTAVDASGRVYFWESSTGKTSWTHPWATPPQKPPAFMTTGFGSLFGNPLQSKSTATGIGGSTTKDDLHNNRNNEAFLPHHQENPLYASKRPDSSECNSVLAFLFCPPIGLLAIYHSFSVNSAWNDGRYGDAVHHARQAPKYGTLAIVVGGVFWIYYFFFRREANFQWPDWDFNFGD